MKNKKNSFLLFACLFFLFSYVNAYADEVPALLVFFSPGCHHCIHVRKNIMPEIEKEFKGKVRIEYRDIEEIENYKLLLALEEKYGSDISNIFPVLYFKGNFLNGQNSSKENIEKMLNLSLAGQKKTSSALPNIDLAQQFKSFTPWAIIGVGLIDGINPCAVTVIVFFMSFLAFQGYRKREIAVVGLIFIFSVYLTYVLIGLGIFGFLYRLEGFWILSKIINITVGIISITFSGFAIYDFLEYRKTKNTEELLLALPKSIKNQIYKVIGKHYRGGANQKSPDFRKHILGLALSALITGFLVSVLEAVCVVKIYLPTIVFVLKTTQLKLRALIYLLLYNLLFILPLLVIFGFALAGTSSERFSAILKGKLGTIKILMALMFLGLGIFLIWRA